MKDFLARRPLLLGALLLGLTWIALSWFLADAPGAKPSGKRATKSHDAAKSGGTRAVGAPRSSQGLSRDARQDVLADARPPDARRESIIRTGIGELQELQQMNQAVFDDAAKRWNAQPRVKELIAQWQAVEAVWKTQDEGAKAAVVPQMEAMWKDALGLLRTEVEQSAREAEAGVK